MAKNYGIKFCENVIKNLEEIENKMFESVGHGFDKYSHENMNLLEYKRLLAKFKDERAKGFLPSYDSAIHGGSD